MYLKFDLVIVGAGLSGGWFLKELLAQTAQSDTHLSIAVIDRIDRSFGGVPYGQNADDHYVLMTPDDELAQTPYLDWCKQKRFYEQRHKRRIFGRFLNEAVKEAIAQSDHSVEFFSATVEAFQKTGDGGYRLMCSNNMEVTSSQVLLAPGSANTQTLPQVSNVPAYVGDMYQQSWEEMHERILNGFEHGFSKANKIVVLGSNAAGSELLYCVWQSPEIMARLGKIIVMSRGGAFPDSGRSDLSPYSCAFLTSATLKDADSLIKALEDDITRAKQQGHTTLDAVLDTRPEFVARFAALNDAEKERFACVYAEAYKRATRRTPAQYEAAVAALRKAGHLEVVATDVALDGVSYGGGIFEIPTDHGVQKSRVLINCLGAAKLEETTDPFIRSLVALYGTSGSGHGLPVGRDFDLDSGVYVLGPMLAGYSQPEQSIWHLESIPRIIKFAHGLAQHVAREIT